MSMTFPINEIRNTGASLMSFAERAQALAARAEAVSASISTCYMKGGVGGRAAECAAEIKTTISVAEHLGSVLKMAADIYENNENDLSSEGRSAANTLTDGYNACWVDRPLVFAVLGTGGALSEPLSLHSYLSEKTDSLQYYGDSANQSTAIQTEARELSMFLSEEKKAQEIRSVFEAKGKVVDARTEFGTGIKRVYTDKTDKNGKRKSAGYFNYTGGCTWYAANRYEQVNGEKSLVFSSAPGNASNWDNAINQEYFDVIDINETTGFKSNTLAISDKASKGTSANHVCYIEAVDGEYVYYSEGAAKHDDESMSVYNLRVDNNYGKIKRMKLEDFRVAYEHIIQAKDNSMTESHS